MSLVSALPFRLWLQWQRCRNRVFSLLCKGAFAAFGHQSIIIPPARLQGTQRIMVGQQVFIGSDCWLQTLNPPGGGVVLRIGDGSSLAGHCVLSAAAEVVLEDHVLLARNVYIADHVHEFRDRQRPILAQGISGIAPVRIGTGAWLGQNVVVCPGVTIGRGAVIAANSVVKRDVPEYCLAAGAPAVVKKTIAS